LELATPWGLDDIQKLQAAQINDVIYLTDGAHWPHVISRHGDQDWRIRTIHEPELGWTPPPQDPLPWTSHGAGTSVTERWHPPANTVLSITQADSWIVSHDSDNTSLGLAASWAPFDASASPRIVRKRAMFHVPSTTDYQFRVTEVIYHARMKFSAVAGGSPTTAQTILNASYSTGEPNATSQYYHLTAGDVHYCEFLFNTWNNFVSVKF